MGTKTLMQRILAKFKPGTQTEFLDSQAAGHKLRGFPGDDSWAKTHQHKADEIREGREDGDSGIFKVPFCMPCQAKGQTLLLLENAGKLWCGTCGWTRPIGKSTA